MRGGTLTNPRGSAALTVYVDRVTWPMVEALTEALADALADRGLANGLDEDAMRSMIVVRAERFPTVRRARRLLRRASLFVIPGAPERPE